MVCPDDAAGAIDGALQALFGMDEAVFGGGHEKGDGRGTARVGPGGCSLPRPIHPGRAVMRGDYPPMGGAGLGTDERDFRMPQLRDQKMQTLMSELALALVLLGVVFLSGRI